MIKKETFSREETLAELKRLRRRVELIKSKSSDTDANHGPESLDDVTKALFNAKTADVVRDLIARGADVEARDDDGWTPLFWIASPDAAQALIEAGCDANALNNDGWTALHCCLNVEVRDVLVNAGADLSIQDGNGATALMGFIERLDEPAPLMSVALVNSGADINLRAKDWEGNIFTALDLAESKVIDQPLFGEVIQVLKAKADRDALNTDDTLDRIKASKPATPKKRGPL